MSLLFPGIPALTPAQQAVVNERRAALCDEDDQEPRTSCHLIGLAHALGFQVVMTAIRPDTFTVGMPDGEVSECHSRLQLGQLVDQAVRNRSVQA